MKTIGFHIQKGGVGKTTTAGHVAWELAKHGKTLMIDLDQQANLTQWFLGNDLPDHELADVFHGEAELTETILQVRDNLFLLPAKKSRGRLKTWSETVLFQKPNTFKKLRVALEELGFDFVVMDMSPGMSMLERSAQLTADEIVPIMNGEVFSFEGLEQFEEGIKSMREDLDLEAGVYRLVLNRINESFKIHQFYKEKLMASKYEVFPVKQSTRLAECVVFRKAIQELDPKHDAVPIYALLAGKIAERQPELLGV